MSRQVGEVKSGPAGEMKGGQVGEVNSEQIGEVKSGQVGEAKLPTVILLVGMAGSGKTTLTTALHKYLSETKRKSVYSINLDPAVRNVSYPINIDIRTTVDYKQVMKQYKLGPNGAIMTCLNLFATRFDQVLGYLDKRAPVLDYVLIDTPGQIEVFNWSASGTIILDSLAATYPTVMTFIVDTVRCDGSPITMMSNMLYACSVLYKSKLPFVTIFNKTDVVSHSRCLTWMRDYDAFQEAVMQDESFMASLTRSCALTMMEFYNHLRTVGVSAATGAGLSDLFAAFAEANTEYTEHYLPWLELQRQRVEEKKKEKAKRSAARLAKDLRNLSLSEGNTEKAKGGAGKEGGTMKIGGDEEEAGPLGQQETRHTRTPPSHQTQAMRMGGLFGPDGLVRPPTRPSDDEGEDVDDSDGSEDENV